MMMHELKILPEYFEAVLAGTKTVELRKEDREQRFVVGDTLRLREYRYYRTAKKYEQGGYTGREVWVMVTHVLRDDHHRWLQPGVVALSIERLPQSAVETIPTETIGLSEYDAPALDRDEILQAVSLQLTAIGEAWRSDWLDFDGRQLRDQLREVIAWMHNPHGSLTVGTEFYHWHVSHEHGEKCPDAYHCAWCEEQKGRQKA